MKTNRDMGADLLLRHAAGCLDAAFSLLIETHLALSPESNRLHAQFEAIGGALIDDITPAEVDPAALNRALRAIEMEAEDVDERPGHSTGRFKALEGFTLPAPLSAVPIDMWRWVAPGVRSARISLPKSAKSRAFLLEIAPGTILPRHGHEGDEATCVLSGGFRDGETHFGPGDLALADESIEHDIVIDAAAPCLCLIALEGRTRPNSWIGQLYQKFRDI